jgi:DNA (cytosine-5)-methyltransferase 1
MDRGLSSNGHRSADGVFNKGRESENGHQPTGYLRFVDLFAGLGGFHLALRSLGHRCVFACEIDPTLRDLYEKNFELRPASDIRLAPPDTIPSHDILCAGFPCQPFSKAGGQEGFDCPRWGDLFGYVLAIIRHHQPHYLILENVPNLEKHDEGDTWHTMEVALQAEGYDVDHHRLSPHHFGIPQIRDRMFIVGTRSPLDDFVWPEKTGAPVGSIADLLDRRPSDAKPIPSQVANCLDVWQDFLDRFPEDKPLPWYPVWSMEFGATYPYERRTPHALGSYRLIDYKGSHGVALRSALARDRMAALPSYARTAQSAFPPWKVQFIRLNRALYAEHGSWIDRWKPRILAFPPSLQKFEWNCKDEERDIWRYIIQFRASGVRVKRPITAPSLVAMTTTQVPIVAWERRYMTPRECARLQSMGELRHLPAAASAFRALGNAVNVEVVRKIACALIPEDEPIPLRGRASVRELSTGGRGRAGSVH